MSTTMKNSLMVRAIELLAIFGVVVAAVGKQILGWRQLSGVFGIVVLTIAALGSIHLALDKTTWLPFLGPAALPPTAFAELTPADASVTVTVPINDADATHVVYWGANSATSTFASPQDAYKSFSNTGVVKVLDGQARMPLRCPGAYTVMGNRTLPRHVHFRIIYKTGLLSEVLTKNVMCL